MATMRLGRVWLHLAAVSGLFFALLLFAGCQTNKSTQDFSEVPGVGPAAAGGAPGEMTSPNGDNAPRTGEILQAGDSLAVMFSDVVNPIPPFEEKIKDDGTITLIYNKVFQAAGKRLGDLEKEIRAFYVPDYFRNLTVTIKLDQGTRFYYVGGEVKAPGRQLYLSRITLTKAIQSAGDFTDFANKKKVRLTRADGHTQRVNCLKALEDPSLDPEVFPGDKITVPRRIL
jgi:protein involved in polysaccharide export with SLBB domain